MFFLAMSTIYTIFAPAMGTNTEQKKPLKWWLELAIAILAALAGALTENATAVTSQIINL